MHKLFREAMEVRLPIVGTMTEQTFKATIGFSFVGRYSASSSSAYVASKVAGMDQSVRRYCLRPIWASAVLGMKSRSCMAWWDIVFVALAVDLRLQALLSFPWCVVVAYSL